MNKKLIQSITKMFAEDLINHNSISVEKVNGEKFNSAYDGYWYDVVIPFKLKSYCRLTKETVKQYESNPLITIDKTYEIVGYITNALEAKGLDVQQSSYCFHKGQFCLYLCVIE